MEKEGEAEWILDFENSQDCPACDCSVCHRTRRIQAASGAYLPCPSCDTVQICPDCHGVGRVPLKTWHLVLTGRRLKTPRVQTLEKAHIERHVEYSMDNIMPKDEGRFEHVLSRLDAWGQLQQEVRLTLMARFRPDPFEGRAILVDFNSKDLSSRGEDLTHAEMEDRLTDEDDCDMIGA